MWIIYLKYLGTNFNIAFEVRFWLSSTKRPRLSILCQLSSKLINKIKNSNLIRHERRRFKLFFLIHREDMYSSWDIEGLQNLIFASKQSISNDKDRLLEMKEQNSKIVALHSVFSWLSKNLITRTTL